MNIAVEQPLCALKVQPSPMKPIRLLSLAAACLALPLTAHFASANSAVTDPVGMIQKNVAPAYEGIAMPLVVAEPFTGGILTNSGSTVTFAGTGLNIGSLLVAGRAYYLEILSGPLEGERIDIDVSATVTAANNQLTLNFAAPHNTLPNLPSNALASARGAVRQHMTLQVLQSLFVPALVGNNNAALADKIYIYEGGWVRYNLRGDGTSWRRPADVTDFRSKIIPPGVGVMAEFVDSPKKLVQVGNVRTNAFRVNLVAGFQAFSPPYPVSMSPSSIGGFVDSNVPANQRWVGNNNSDLADQILPFAGGFVRYNLRADGVTWRRPADVTNYANSPIILYDGVSIIKRTNPDPTYLILRPFSL
jgi:hypothetical protein